MIRRFHFALSDPGFLFLGKAEMLLNHATNCSSRVDLRKRLFRKIRGSRSRRELSRLVPRTAPAEPGRSGRRQAAGVRGPGRRGRSRSSRSTAAASSLPPTPGPRRCSTCGRRDVGRPFQDLEVSYRPVELRSIIEEVITEQRPAELH